MKKFIKHISTIIVIGLFSFLAYGSAEDVDVKDKQVEVKTSAIKLCSAYDSNSIGADDKYKDKVMLISGTIISIDKDFLDELYVELQGDEYGLINVECYFAEEDKGKLSKLSKGTRLVVKGYCIGQEEGPIALKGCIIQ